jgi:hypothetical protein
MVGLVLALSFSGGAAPLEVAPEPVVPSFLDDRIQPGEQRAVAGRHDGVVQG